MCWFDSVHTGVLLTAPAMFSCAPMRLVKSGLPVLLVLVLLALAPCAAAMDVHHELAAADTDGHEHSDNDLCQWVQQHSSGSVDLGDPVFCAGNLVTHYPHPPQFVLFSHEFLFIGPSRAPSRKGSSRTYPTAFQDQASPIRGSPILPVSPWMCELIPEGKHCWGAWVMYSFSPNQRAYGPPCSFWGTLAKRKGRRRLNLPAQSG